MAERLSNAVLGWALFFVFVATAACGGGSKDEQATAEEPRTTAQGAKIPSGWDNFAEGRYSGAIKNDWIVGSADLGLLIGSSSQELKSFPPAIQKAWEQGVKDGTFKDTVIVWVDFNETYATNIQMGGCNGDAKAVAPYVADDRRFIEVYRSLGINAQLVGRIPFGNTDALFVRVLPGQAAGFDAYQAVLLHSECWTTVQLFTRSGDQSSLQDFKTFISLLSFK